MPAQDAPEVLIVALDLPHRAAALAMVDLLPAEVLWYKVGLELYLAEGAPMVRELRARGKRVFLDLKLHDIPNTVAAATRIAARTGAELLTIHAAGGPAMVRSAVEAADGLSILAITVLTSMNEEELSATGIAGGPAAQVERIGCMALNAGAAGLICSPLEVASLRREHGSTPLLVVPGIRGGPDAPGDQQRTASAADTLRARASKLVVGRPITRAPDPCAAADRVLREIKQVLRELHDVLPTSVRNAD